MDKVIKTVNSLYQGLIFLAQNFKEIITTLSTFKVALIVTIYLVDKFIGLDEVIIQQPVKWHKIAYQCGESLTPLLNVGQPVLVKPVASSTTRPPARKHKR